MGTLSRLNDPPQPNIPAIYCELEQRSFRRMRKVTFRSMGLCFCVYTLMGIPGFLAFEGGRSSIIRPCKQKRGVHWVSE